MFLCMTINNALLGQSAIMLGQVQDHFKGRQRCYFYPGLPYKNSRSPLKQKKHVIAYDELKNKVASAIKNMKMYQKVRASC